LTAYLYLQPYSTWKPGPDRARQVPLDYFKSFDTALRAARLYTDIVISYVA